jgi:hypothetical protein
MRMTNKVTRRLMKKRESEVEHLKGPEKSIYYTERMRPRPKAGEGRSRSLPRQRPTIIDSPGELSYVCVLLVERRGGGARGRRQGGGSGREKGVGERRAGAGGADEWLLC